MKIRIMEQCDCGDKHCEAVDYFEFATKLFRINFFNDYGTKFLRVRFRDKQKKWMWD